MLQGSNIPVHASIAQMVERKTLNLVVVGSIPTGGGLFFLVEKSQVTLSILISKEGLQEAFLAQMVERWPFKPMAVGSIPTEGVFFYVKGM